MSLGLHRFLRSSGGGGIEIAHRLTKHACRSFKLFGADEPECQATCMARGYRCLLFILLFSFQFPFFTGRTLGLFLLFSLAFILTSLVTHGSFSVIENEFARVASLPHSIGRIDYRRRYSWMCPTKLSRSKLDQIEMKSDVGRLVTSFERKAA
jgi:hypothetical protein